MKNRILIAATCAVLVCGCAHRLSGTYEARVPLPQGYEELVRLVFDGSKVRILDRRLDEEAIQVQEEFAYQMSGRTIKLALPPPIEYPVFRPLHPEEFVLQDDGAILVGKVRFIKVK